MSLIKNMVYFCSVSRDSQILYAYSNGDHETEKLSALCLERAPKFHKWYFETMRKRTFGFFMDDGLIYFTIVDEGLGNRRTLQFLQQVRDGFKRINKRGWRGSLSSLSSVSLREQVAPVVCQLIKSLENGSHGSDEWTGQSPSLLNDGKSPSPGTADNQGEVSSSTKVPLLGKANRQDKRKGKDHIITMKDIEMNEQHRKSMERGLKGDSASSEPSNPGRSGSSASLQKEPGSMRNRSSGSQSFRKKWWCLVRTVLAIDAAVCLILLVIWLLVCHGISCIR